MFTPVGKIFYIIFHCIIHLVLFFLMFAIFPCHRRAVAYIYPCKNKEINRSHCFLYRLLPYTRFVSIQNKKEWWYINHRPWVILSIDSDVKAPPSTYKIAALRKVLKKREKYICYDALRKIVVVKHKCELAVRKVVVA